MRAQRARFLKIWPLKRRIFLAFQCQKQPICSPHCRCREATLWTLPLLFKAGKSPLLFFALNLRVPPSLTCIWHDTPCIWPPKLPRTQTPMLRYNASPTHHTSSAAHSARMLSAQLDVLNPPIFPKSDSITWAIVAPFMDVLSSGSGHTGVCIIPVQNG